MGGLHPYHVFVFNFILKLELSLIHGCEVAVPASREHLRLSEAGVVSAWLTPIAVLFFRCSGCSTNDDAMWSTPDFSLEIQPILALIKLY
jgi:hypothetical protein